MTPISYGACLAGLALALSLAGTAPARADDDRRVERPTGSGGVGIGIDLFGIFDALRNSASAQETPPSPPLARQGPQIPPVQSMLRWRIDAVLKGGWPVVVAYRAPAGTAFELSFEVDGEAPLRRSFEGNAEGRGFVQFTLPENFGESVRPGIVRFRAIRALSGPTQSEPRLLGLGGGPLAVGSVAIDQVVFEPPTVRIGAGQRAFYGFHSRSDFNRAAVDFARLEHNGGEVRMVRVHSEEVRQSVSRNTWIGREPALTWNGQGGDASVSRGPHLLLVRAWAPEPGDWVVAWSPDTVTVTP